MKLYRSMRKIYYDVGRKPDAVKQELTRRRESISSIQLDFKIGEYPAFIVYCDEIVSEISAIYRMCRKVERMLSNLPPIVMNQYIKQSLIEEIHQTNEIENVHSTRKEIRESMELITSGKNNLRFEGMIRKYQLLLNDEPIPLSSCQDMRSLYDSFVSEEVRREDVSNLPDGIYFRSQPVGIHDGHDRKIHEGVFPESMIHEYMEHALDFLNNEDYDLFIRAAAFHYMFGYIHPFYDGNGRMTRFISSYILARGDIPLPICLRLSYVIKEYRKEYYRIFKDTNDKHNYGDMTGFVIEFMKLIFITSGQVFSYLQETDQRLQAYEQLVYHLDLTEAQRQVLITLIQLSVCSDFGMSREDLAKICGMSKTKLIGILLEIESYVVIIKEGKKYLYRADMDKLDEMMEQQEA